MDYLNRGYAQLSDLWASMTVGARIACGLLLALVVVSMAYLYHDQVSGSDAYLLGGEPFSAAQLRDIQAAFGKAGLEGYSLDGAKIKVPRGQQSKYMAALADANALPVDFGEYLQKAVSANPFFVSRAQQEAVLRVANQRELQNIINALPGVASSAVHIDEQVQRGAFPQQKSLITASVSILPKGNQPLEESKVPGVRSLVAGWVAGLKPEAVTVFDLSTGRAFAGNGGQESAAGTAGGDYADCKRRLELDWQEKISRLLAQIVPGAFVTTNVELDPEVSNEERLTQYDGGSPPGERRAAAPTAEKHIVREGRTPKRVTVSVAIPSSHYEEIWRKRGAAAPASRDNRPDPLALAEIENAEKKKIETAILPLLGNSDRTIDVSSQVAVTTFYPLDAPLPAELTWGDIGLAWLNRNWSAVSLGGLALVGLVGLRSIVRSLSGASMSRSTAAARENRAGLSLVVGDTPDASSLGASRASAPRRTPTGPSLRDELAGMVRDDPDAAVGILRTWIGNAS